MGRYRMLRREVSFREPKNAMKGAVWPTVRSKCFRSPTKNRSRLSVTGVVILANDRADALQSAIVEDVLLGTLNITLSKSAWPILSTRLRKLRPLTVTGSPLPDSDETQPCLAEKNCSAPSSSARRGCGAPLRASNQRCGAADRT